MIDTTATTDTDAEPNSPDDYARLLQTVAYQTGDPQHVLVSGRGLWTVISHGSLRMADAITAMQAAIENDHVLRWRGGAGRHRYGLTTAGIEATPHVDAPLFGPADVPTLREVLDTEASRDDPSQAVIAWANRRLAAIEEATDD